MHGRPVLIALAAACLATAPAAALDVTDTRLLASPAITAASPSGTPRLPLSVKIEAL